MSMQFVTSYDIHYIEPIYYFFPLFLELNTRTSAKSANKIARGMDAYLRTYK